MRNLHLHTQIYKQKIYLYIKYVRNIHKDVHFIEQIYLMLILAYLNALDEPKHKISSSYLYRFMYGKTSVIMFIYTRIIIHKKHITWTLYKYNSFSAELLRIS